jgi:hypothetical protein
MAPVIRIRYLEQLRSTIPQPGNVESTLTETSSDLLKHWHDFEVMLFPDTGPEGATASHSVRFVLLKPDFVSVRFASFNAHVLWTNGWCAVGGKE